MHSRSRSRFLGIVILAVATSMCGAPQPPTPAPVRAPAPGQSGSTPTSTAATQPAQPSAAQPAPAQSTAAQTPADQASAESPAARPAAAGRRIGIVGGFTAYPPATPAELARGHQLFASNCSFCHGSDARGGETGPNLVRDQIVLDDQHGEKLAPIVHTGFPAQGMPRFALSDSEIAAIAAWLHAQPLSDRGQPSRLDILVGSASRGQAYFERNCVRCHSVSGDLAGIGAKYDPKTIQNLIVSGGRSRSFGRGAARSAPPPKVPQSTVAVTLPSGQTVSGTLDHITAFVVALREPDGTYRSFARHGDTPKVVVTNPLEWHLDMLERWRDSDIHDLTAYLATLK